MNTRRDQFIQALGQAGERSGVFGATAGKIFGVLYLSPGPLSLEEITLAVGISKGNASMQVRELLALGMVSKVWVRGSRRDHYEAEADLWTIAMHVIGRRLEQEAQALLTAMEGIEVEGVEGQRLRAMRSFLETSVALIAGFRQGQSMSPADLKKAAG